MNHISGASRQPTPATPAIGGKAQINEFASLRVAELEQLLTDGAESGDPERITALRSEHFREYIELSRKTRHAVPHNVRQAYGMEAEIELLSDSFVQSKSKGARVIIRPTSSALHGTRLERLGEEINKVPHGVELVLDLSKVPGLPEHVRDVFLGALLERQRHAPVWIVTSARVGQDLKVRKLDQIFRVVASENEIR